MFLVMATVLSGCSNGGAQETYDVVILNGRVMDPETGFDGSLLFAQQLIAIEAAFDPVTFRSLTTFDATGFASQCIYADVTICGAKLYTKAEFDFSGINLVTFGFDFSFGS